MWTLHAMHRENDTSLGIVFVGNLDSCLAYAFFHYVTDATTWKLRRYLMPESYSFLSATHFLVIVKG